MVGVKPVMDFVNRHKMARTPGSYATESTVPITIAARGVDNRVDPGQNGLTTSEI